VKSEISLHTGAESHSTDTVFAGAVDQTENMADAEFQVRHDRYEILEKKKYMAYMEWGLNKKNGTR